MRPMTQEDVKMVPRLAIPAIVALGAAWVLVQPDTPPPEARPDARPEVAVLEPDVAEPDTAIALLGETWSVGAPAPIERPLTAAEHAAARAALRQPAPGTSESRAAAAAVPDLRRPLPRPERSVRTERASYVERSAPSDGVVVLSQDSGDMGPPPPVIVLRGDAPVVSRADDLMRWVVRQQGSGAVLAELPLSEALAILTSRQP
jgi:hypothetical protein